MSTLIEVADAVVAAIQAGSYGEPITVQRKYQPLFELAELTQARVSVVPKSVTITNASRSAGSYDCAIDVGVQKKLDTDDAAQLDTMMDLVEQVADQLRMKRLEEKPDAAWLSIQNEPVYAPQHLDQQRMFTSVLTVTYRVPR